MTMDHEARLLNSISREALWETNRTIAGWTRNSGTAEERAAFAYVQETLDGYGMDTHLLEHPALISYPLAATLATLNRDGQETTQSRMSGHSLQSQRRGAGRRVSRYRFRHAGRLFSSVCGR